MIAMRNIKVLGFIGIVYISLEVAVANVTVPALIRNHGIDLLAVPMLLSIGNLLAHRSPFPNVFMSSSVAIATTVVAAWEWELVAPLYTASTPDIFDVGAYFVGTMSYLVVGRRWLQHPRIAAGTRLTYLREGAARRWRMYSRM